MVAASLAIFFWRSSSVSLRQTSFVVTLTNHLSILWRLDPAQRWASLPSDNRKEPKCFRRGDCIVRIVRNPYTVAAIRGPLALQTRVCGWRRPHRQAQVGMSEKDEKRRHSPKPLHQMQMPLWWVIIFQKAKAMYNRFYELGNMELFSCHDLDNPSAPSLDLRKPEDPTSLGNDGHEEHEFFYQKSTNNLATGYEISFEKGFMKEHQTVYEKQLSNFMEFCGTSQNKITTDQACTHFPAPKANHNFNSIQNFLRSEVLGLSAQRVENLFEKLMEFDKLEEFLDIVTSQTETAILIELVSLAESLVRKYEEIKIEEPSDSQLLEESAKIAREVDIKKLIAVRSISSSVVNEKARRFVEVFCATAMLVVAQYFVNPYSDDESGCLKRPLSPWSLEDSEEEESFEPSPSKKRKFSF